MPFGSLWLPVVVSTVAVFLVSSVLHMVLKYHRADVKPLSDESEVAPALRKAAPAPGVYILPYCAEMSQMKDPAFIKKYEEGPVALLTVLKSGVPNMGKSLGLWFLFCFLVSFTVGYLARHTLGFDTDPRTVLQITGAVAFVGYGYGRFQDSIWHGVPWSNSLRGLIDAAVYAVVTGLVFRFLWPEA